MDSTVVSSLIGVGSSVLGTILGAVLHWYFAGSSTASTSTDTTASSTTEHPILSALTNQFDSAVTQFAQQLVAQVIPKVTVPAK